MSEQPCEEVGDGELLRAVLSATNDAVVHIQRDGTIASWNGTAERMFGYTAADAVGASLSSLIVPSSRQHEADELWRRLERDQRVERFDTVRRHKEGSPVYVSVTMSALLDASGRFSGAVKLLHDRGEQVHSDESIEFQREIVRSMGEIAKVGGWSIDAATGEGYWTEEVARIHELDPNDPISKQKGIEFYYGESRAKITEAVERAIRDAEPYDLELELKTARGHRKWVRTIGHPVLHEGRVVTVRGSFQDITEHKQSTLMLAAQYMVGRTLLSADTLAEAAPALVRALCSLDRFVCGFVLELDRTTQLLHCVGAWRAMDGRLVPLATTIQEGAFPADAGINGQACQRKQVVWSTDIARDAAPAQLAALVQAAGVAAVLIVPILGPDGVAGTIALLASDFEPPDAGRCAGLMAIGNQVAQFMERRNARVELERLNAELEARVLARTDELALANRELESFSYSVSHDLRSPLRAINGFAHALVMEIGGELSPDAQQYFDAICSNTSRMARLIDDLLLFSKLGRAPVQLATLDMAASVSSTLDDLASERAGRVIELSIGALPPCRGDASLIKQVWTNLLSNALKYTGKCDVARINVGFDDGAYFVRDNGAGFDAKYANKLFGVFQRLHSAEEFEGTGVGLAIVQRIVQRHGGEIWGAGEVGRGATFHFRLP